MGRDRVGTAHRLLLAALVALSLALVALSGPVLAVSGAVPAGSLLLVVSPPGAAARDTLIRTAGGVPVGPAQTPIAGLATSNAPGFAERLRAAGAWAVFDGAWIGRICGGAR